jgi:putative addiction module CopG family antidote
MEVRLSPELQEFIKNLVEQGLYSCSSDVVSEALRMLQVQEDYRARQLAEFLQEIDRRLATPDSEHIPAEQVFAELRERSRRLRERMAS